MRMLTSIEVESVSGGDGGILEIIGPDGSAESLDKLLARFFQLDSGGAAGQGVLEEVLITALKSDGLSAEQARELCGKAWEAGGASVGLLIGLLWGKQIGGSLGFAVGTGYGPLGAIGGTAVGTNIGKAHGWKIGGAVGGAAGSVGGIFACPPGGG